MDDADPLPRRSPPATRAGWAAQVVGFAIVGLLLNVRSLPAGFVGDDLEELLRAVRPTSAAVEGHGNLRPLFLATLRANHALGGLDPSGYHLVNVALHVACALLVSVLAAALVRRWRAAWGRTDRRGELPTARAVGVVAGATFLVLPTHTEAVSWIAGRADLLATLGSLVAAVAWLGAERRTPRSVVVAGLAFVAALAAKESAITLPVALAIADLALLLGPRPGRPGRGDRLRRAVVGTAPLLTVLAAYLVVRWARVGTIVGSYDGTGAFDRNPARVGVRAVAMGVRTVVPGLPPAGWIAVLAVAVAGGGAAVLAIRRVRPIRSLPTVPVAAAAAAVLVLVLPAAGLGTSWRDTVGERLTYLASTVTAGVLGWILATLAARWRTTGVVAVALLLAAGAGTVVHLDGRWRRAGDLADQLLVAAPAWDRPARVVVLNPPDTIGGTYVTRNALLAGPALLHGWDDPDVAEVTRVRFATAEDRTSVVAGDDGRTWRLRLAAGARFEVTEGGALVWAVPGVSATVVGNRDLLVRVDATVEPSALYYVSEGRLRELPGRTG